MNGFESESIETLERNRFESDVLRGGKDGEKSGEGGGTGWEFAIRGRSK